MSLEVLMMDLNPLGGKGGAALLMGAAGANTTTTTTSNEEREKEEVAGEGVRRRMMEEGEEGVRRRRGVRVLSMAGCGLGDECWQPLVAALTLTSSLKYVCLAANTFTQVSL